MKRNVPFCLMCLVVLIVSGCRGPGAPAVDVPATETAIAQSVLATLQAQLALTPVPVMVITATPLPVVAIETPPPIAEALTPTPTAPLEATPIPLEAATPLPPTATPTATSSPTPEVLTLADLQNKILFLSDREGEEAIYMMDPDGSNQVELENPSLYDEACYLDTLSPDGQWRVGTFVNRAAGDNLEIFSERIDGTSKWIVTMNTANDYSPAWSPADDGFAFVSDRTGNGDIYWTNKLGTENMRLTDPDQPNPAADKHPSWSPDATKIVFWSDRDGRRQIYVMDRNGRNQTNISNNAFNDWDPVWVK